MVLAGPDGALELRAFAAPATATSGARSGRRSPPTWRAGRHRHRAEGRFGTRAVVPAARCRRPTADRRPAVADHRHQRPALAAARHVPRQAGRSTPTPPTTWEDTLTQDRRTPRRPRDAGRRAAAGDAAGPGPPGDATRRTPGLVTWPGRAGCGAASAAGRAAPTTARPRPAARPAQTTARYSDRGRARPRAGAGCAARCAPSRCGRAAASPPSRPSSTTAPASLTIVWLGRRRIAGIGPGRSLQVHGPDRCARGDPDHLQPALRADAVSRPERTSQDQPRAVDVETVEAGRARPARQGARAAGAG